MKDPAFIDAKLKRGLEAKEKAQKELSGLSVEELNWKPSPTVWSVGECLDHLIISDSSYFPALERIALGSYRLTFFEQFSPLSSLWGKSLKSQLKENVGRKMVAPKRFRPNASNTPADILNKYLQNLDVFLSYVSKSRDIDLDKTIITSPAASIVTYNLRDAYQFLMEHEHRHINQAIRVKEILKSAR